MRSYELIVNFKFFAALFFILFFFWCNRMFRHINCVPLPLHHFRGVFFSTFYWMLLQGLLLSAHASLGCGVLFIFFIFLLLQKTTCMFLLCSGVRLVLFFCLFCLTGPFPDPLRQYMPRHFRTLSALRLARFVSRFAS